MTVESRQEASHPPNLYPEYKSTAFRSPRKAPLPPDGIDSFCMESLPLSSDVGPRSENLLLNTCTTGEPIGERIVVSGKVLDGDGAPLAGSLVEIWQANAAGRYAHKVDRHDAPLDKNFLGVGRALTDDEGRFKFYTIRPGAYPWGNHDNAWRPPHIHFSVIGNVLENRLITQMYFPGDPLLDHDPIFQSVPDRAKDRLIAGFDLTLTEPEFALGYRFDLVVRGFLSTPETT